MTEYKEGAVLVLTDRADRTYKRHFTVGKRYTIGKSRTGCLCVFTDEAGLYGTDFKYFDRINIKNKIGGKLI